MQLLLVFSGKILKHQWKPLYHKLKDICVVAENKCNWRTCCVGFKVDMLRNVASWDDVGKEAEEDEAEEEHHICAEERPTQISVMDDEICEQAKRCAQPSQER